MRKYINRVRAARREEKCAQEALDFDYESRIHNGGPWDEDDTYLRLNSNVHFRRSGVLDSLRNIVGDDPYPWQVDDSAEQVGMILRHCTKTERGARLADLWDRLNDVDTASIELVEED